MSEKNFEKNEYVNKLSLQINGMNELLSMDSFGLIDFDSHKRIEDLRNTAEKLRNKLEKNEFEIAIVGLEKAGKSTFANAIMGNDILPAKPARCTYTSTSIRYGKNHAEVKFFSKEEFEKNFRDNLKLLDIEYADKFSYKTLSLNEYESIFEKLPEATKNYFRGTVNEDIKAILQYKNHLSEFIGRDTITFSGDELNSSRFKNFIEEPQYAIAVKEITVCSEKFGDMQQAVIYDVPGFDSPTEMHKKQTKERMNAADVIILVAGADKPSLTGPQLDIFRAETDDDGIRFGDKMFVFANRADIAVTLDSNVKLKDNMMILKKELQKYHIIIREDYLENRVVPGSAKTCLTKEPSAMEALKKAGIDDGIRSILDKLTAYNDNERFDVLKQRVNKIQADLQNLFEELFKKQKVNADSSFYEISTKIVQELSRSARISILKALDAFKYEINEKYSSENLPITKKLKSDIADKITVDKYGVTDEELNDARNKAIVLDNVKIISEIESEIRKTKYKVIRSDFVGDVVNFSINEHESCDKSIVKIFVEGFKITSGNIYFERLESAITEFVNKAKISEDNQGYYRSLVDRFSYDLFEILIRLAFGDSARWEKFCNDSANFYSLAMFDVNRNEFLPLDKQPLYYSLLFHDKRYTDMEEYISAAVKEVESIIGASLGIDDEIIKIVYQIALTSLDKTAEFIKSKCLSYSDNGDSGSKRISVFNRLSNELEIIKESGTGVPNLDQEYYQNYFKGKMDKTLEDVKVQINEDIDILREVLKNSAVEAIHIEKPFLSLEIETLNSLEDKLDSSEFDAFVRKNASLIASERFANLEEEEQKLQLRKEICRKIESILDLMKKSPTTV